MVRFGGRVKLSTAVSQRCNTLWGVLKALLNFSKRHIRFQEHDQHAEEQKPTLCSVRTAPAFPFQRDPPLWAPKVTE